MFSSIPNTYHTHTHAHTECTNRTTENKNQQNKKSPPLSMTNLFQFAWDFPALVLKHSSHGKPLSPGKIGTVGYSIPHQ